MSNCMEIVANMASLFFPLLLEIFFIFCCIIGYTRKYPLRGYILGVLTHTTALDQLWGGDETLTMWF